MSTLKNLRAEDVAGFGNYKLTFHMQSPIMLGHPWLALDGILAHLINRELRGQDYWTLPSKEPVHAANPQNVMPLFKTRFLGQGDLYHASVAWFDCDEASTATVYKRFDESRSHLIDTQKAKIDIGRGHFKAYAMRLPYVPARTATFYMRGNLMTALSLLSHLPGLGKKVAYGYGMIRNVSVEETSEDFSLVKDGVAMRPLPLFYADSNEKMMLAWKQPYWARENVDACVPPGAKVSWISEPAKAS